MFILSFFIQSIINLVCTISSWKRTSNTSNRRLGFARKTLWYSEEAHVNFKRRTSDMTEPERLGQLADFRDVWRLGALVNCVYTIHHQRCWYFLILNSDVKVASMRGWWWEDLYSSFVYPFEWTFPISTRNSSWRFKWNRLQATPYTEQMLVRSIILYSAGTVDFTHLYTWHLKCKIVLWGLATKK